MNKTDEEDFKQFCMDMEEFTSLIDQKRSLKTTVKVKSPWKKTLSKLRHGCLLYKIFWSEAESWISLPKAILYFLALTPLALATFNGAMEMFNIPLIIPLGYGTLITFFAVALVGMFGRIANRNFGLRKGHNALAIKQNAGWFMAWKMWKEIKNLREEMKK